MELKRDEIVKALECCAFYCDKEHCKYKSHDNPIACMVMKMIDALSLIKELTEGIKARNDTISRFIETMPLVKADTVRKMQERFWKEVGNFGDYQNWEIAEAFEKIEKEMIGEAK